MGVKSSLPEFAERVSNRIGIVFARVPLSPNQWTVLSAVPALAGFWFLAHGAMAEGVVLFAFSAVMDAIDGGVARVTGAASRFGAYLDGMVDRMVEALLLFGLMVGGLAPDWILPSYAWIAIVLFAGTAMTSFSKAYAGYRKAVADEKKLGEMGGILERAERLALVFAGMCAFFWNPAYLTYALAGVAGLACLTVVQRMAFVARNSE